MEKLIVGRYVFQNEMWKEALGLGKTIKKANI